MSLLILVVDDEPSIRFSASNALEQIGYSVITAEHGKEALRIIEEYQPHLVITDITMPQMDGYEFISELRQHPQWRSLPVIVLTAKDLSSEERQWLSEQTQRVYSKGASNRQLLLDEIRSLIKAPQRS